MFDLSWLTRLDFQQYAGSGKNKHQHRVNGLSSVKAGDVVVYNLNPGYVAVKRCVALAGDVVEINNGDVVVNKNKMNFSNDILNVYKLFFTDRKLFIKYLYMLDKKRQLLAFDSTSRSMIVKLPVGQIDSIGREMEGIKIKNHFASEYSNQEKLFTISHAHWNANNMGPLWVPKSGMQIALNPESIRLYGNTIEKFEDVRISNVGNAFFINGQHVSKYQFKNNYYFMMGDNRNKSSDSRFNGFIPESYIIGKVTYILYSSDKYTFRFDRLFQEIN